MSAYGHLPHFRSVSFTVHGLPAPQGSKRHVGRGVMIEQSKRVKPWRAAVRDAALTAITEWEHLGRTWVPYAGPVYATRDDCPICDARRVGASLAAGNAIIDAARAEKRETPCP